MAILKYGFWVLLGMSAFVLLIFAISSRKPVRCIMLSAALGVGAMIILNLLSPLSGVRIPVNLYTVTAAGAFGIPGLIGTVLLQTVML